MKKLLTATVYLMILLLILLPLGAVFLAVIGYSLELLSYTGFAIFSALVSLTGLILYLKGGELPETKGVKICLSVLPVFAIISGFLCLAKACTIPTALSMATLIFCSGFLSSAVTSSKLQRFYRILTWLAVIVLVYLVFLMLFIGSLWQSTHAYTVHSHDDRHYAEVRTYFDSDHNSASYARIYENKGTDLFLIKIKKNVLMPHSDSQSIFKGIRVYSNVHWTDENKLVIDGTDYMIHRGKCVQVENTSE